MHQTGMWHRAFNGSKVSSAVHPLQAFLGHDRGIGMVQEIDQTGCNELILYRAQARRLFRVVCTHVVQQAIRMRDECDGHDASGCMRFPESLGRII